LPPVVPDWASRIYRPVVPTPEKDSSNAFGTRKKAVQKGVEFYTSSCPLVPDISLGRM